MTKITPKYVFSLHSTAHYAEPVHIPQLSYNVKKNMHNSVKKNQSVYSESRVAQRNMSPK